MEITQQTAGDWLELSVRGRLDGYWSDHFAAALDERVRQGAHHIRLNLSEVDFLSSAGIRVLLRGYKQLNSIQGRLTLSNPSESVKKVLELSGLTALLIAAEAVPEGAAHPAPTSTRAERGGVAFETFEAASSAGVRCRVVGDPGLLDGCRFGAEHCSQVPFPDSAIGLGLGALGSGFEDCRDRLGEFLAVAGAVTYLPTDGTGVPDYLVARGNAVPDLTVCYGITCEGNLGRLIRFEQQTDEPVSLSDLVAGALELTGSERAGFAIVAETSGLMGAALRRSPGLGPLPDAPLSFPRVREWVSFTAERSYSHALALVVGVADRKPAAALAPLLRPLAGNGLSGHFHAAAFSYRPLPKGAIDLKSTVSALFEVETLLGVLHLLNDPRPLKGGGQSTFVRGACWVGAITE